jgi:hypothetical protein
MFIHHYPIPERYGGYPVSYMASFHKQAPAKTAEIRRWCFETFGPPGYLVNTAETRWTDDVKHGEIVFQREADFMLFVLKWS